MLADEPELGEALLGDGPAFDPAVAAAAGIGPADVASGDGAATMASLLAECSDIGPPLPPQPTTVPPQLSTVASGHASLPPAPPLEVAAAAALVPSSDLAAPELSPCTPTVESRLTILLFPAKSLRCLTKEIAIKSASPQKPAYTT